MKHLLNILDLSTKEIDELIAVALDIEAHPEKYSESCKGKILATLFFEPSTRTRLSFETAMLSLGGSVAGFSSASSSSAAKGESVSDTVEVVSGYVDIIAMRHPKEGAPYVAKRRTFVPIVNAGDGGHYHPTQTLADLMTIYKKKGAFENLTIGLCGDLKYGRTVHSLIEAMSRYKGVKFCLISPEELKLPDFVKKEYIEDKGIEFEEVFSLEEAIPSLDVLYMTRIQKERFLNAAEYERLKDSYVLDEEKMKLFRECDLKICMCFSDSWHIGKIKYFLNDKFWSREIDDSYVILLDKAPRDSQDFRSRINICGRKDTVIADRIGNFFSVKEGE